MVKSTGCFSGGPGFNSQQPQGGSQPSGMGSDTLFSNVGVYGDRALIYNIHKINPFKKALKQASFRMKRWLSS